MLGESHALTIDFPEFQSLIDQLSQSDSTFAQANKDYTLLDTKIRKLELNGAPIDDDAMHRLKQQRAQQKDTLYQQLRATQSQGN